jgi:hypothetical protein
LTRPQRCLAQIPRALPIVALATMLLPCIAAGPTTRDTRLALAKSLWEDRLAKAGGKSIASDCYPTEEALVFLTAFDFTRDARYAQQAATQLNYCHSREIDGLFVTYEKLTTREYQARHIYNFYLAYRILGDGKHLRWADGCAKAMIRTLPRRPHTSHGQTHTLFESGFVAPDGKLARENSEVIDANQNAEIALAFSLLYHDPASAYFRDPLAKEIAYEELLASMSIQNMTTGAISLTEHIEGADTAYGSYAAFSWTWCQLLWHDDQFEPHVQAAGRWLAPMQHLDRDAQRYYPTRIENGPVPFWQAYYGLPILWYSHHDASAIITQLFARIEFPGEAYAKDTATAPLYWAYFDLMGMPREFFLDGAAPTPRR